MAVCGTHACVAEIAALNKPTKTAVRSSDMKSTAVCYDIRQMGMVTKTLMELNFT
jgi:hypothetical protein